MNAKSMESWKEEFYPVTAEEMKDRFDSRSATAADLIKHCIRKWVGARGSNLVRHGLSKVSDDSFLTEGAAEAEEEECFDFDSGSCALCVAYQSQSVRYHSCEDCPLYVSRDHVSCTSKSDSEDISPYDEFIDNNDPEPMIEALEDALSWVNNRSEKKG